MRTELLAFWLALAGIGITAADVAVQPNFDVAKFAGKWYPIQMVLESGLANDIAAVSVLATPRHGGKLHMDVTLFTDEKCHLQAYRLSGGTQPGRFIAEGGEKVCIVKTDYVSYSILHVHAGTHKVLYLQGRSKEVSDHIKQKFKKTAADLGFPVGHIMNIQLIEEVQCP